MKTFTLPVAYAGGEPCPHRLQVNGKRIRATKGRWSREAGIDEKAYKAALERISGAQGKVRPVGARGSARSPPRNLV